MIFVAAGALPALLRCRAPFGLLVALAFMAPLAWRPAQAYVPPGAGAFTVGDEYLALGDSLATGVGSSACPIGCAGRSGYVADFARRLESFAGHSIAVRDLAVDGETTGSFVSDYFSSASSRSQLARAVAAIRSHGGRIGPVTLDIGGNDALNVRGPNHSRAEKLAALTTIRANLEAIVSTLQSELQVATSPGELVLLAYYEPYGDDDPDLWAMGRLNQTIADVGREYGLRVAEPYAAFVGVERQTTWMSCRCVIDIHPNDRGYDLIGDALASVTIGPAAADGNVVGVVRDATGAPVAGASVWYGGASVLTAADGSYRFNGVPAGVTLRFEAGDASNADLDGASLTLAPGQSVIQNFVLSVSDSGMALQSSASTRGVAGFARIGAAVVQAAGRAAAQAAHDRAAADLSRAKTGAAGLAGKATAAIAHLRRQIP